MPPSAKTVSKLLGLLYEASASPADWPVFLDALGKECQAASAAFVLRNPEGLCKFEVTPGFDASSHRSYAEYFCQHDVLLERFMEASKLHGGWIGTSQTVMTDAEYHRSVVFNEFAKPLGHVHQIGATLEGLDGGLEGGVTLHRGAQSEPFGRGAAMLLTMLAPHLKRATNTHHALSSARSQTAGLRQSVEALDLAILSLDRTGRVVRMSAAAQAILDLQRGICVEDGFLRAMIPWEQTHLAAMIAGAVATGAGRTEDFAVPCATHRAPQAGNDTLWTGSPGGALVISRIPPSRPLRVVVSPFRSGEVLLQDRPAALVFLSDPDIRPASRASVLSALYRLTPTECRLVDLLTEGSDLATAAERMRMTSETGRFHLKMIFRKTGARRQSELMRLVLGLPGGWAS